MLEIELKFQIPQEKRELLLKVMQRKNVQCIQLQAQYFDTPNFDLSKHKISLRQRRENNTWIQTLKIPTEHHLKRVEFEHPISTQNDVQTSEQSEHDSKNLQHNSKHVLDLALYRKNKSIPKQTRQLISSMSNDLQIQFETQVERFLSLFHFQNSQIEVCLDIGQIYAHDQSTEIFEIEFELKHGTIQDLISFILPRVKRYNLWLDIQSKAQTGFKLAQNIAVPPVKLQHVLKLDQHDSKESALKKMINNTLEHLLPNTTAIASQNFDHEHIHQARVAIRRLRSVLSSFSDWSQHTDASWAKELAYFFKSLGSTRDLDVFTTEILPQITALNVAQLNFNQIKLFNSKAIPPSSNEDSVAIDQIFRSNNFTNLILSLMQFVHEDPVNESKNNLQKSALKVIQKLHQKTIQDAETFLELDIDSRHKTRKRLKKIRYSIELISSLYPNQNIKKYLKALKQVQQSLGQYNDFIVAEELLKAHVDTEPKIWFAIGWIVSKQELYLNQSALALKKFAQIKPFWLEKL